MCFLARMRRLLSACLIALVLALSGCGGGGETSASTGAERGQLPGVRGEHIGTEAAGTLHISSSDCGALRKLAESQTHTGLDEKSEASPPSSRCRLTAPGVRIGIYLDNGRSAHQRYENRMVEQDQFGAPDPGKLAHAVPHVGDPAPGNQNASWVPDLASLFAARGNRWLTVAYSADGVDNAHARDRAAALARAGFRLTSE
jgi:hypothetical protein